MKEDGTMNKMSVSGLIMGGALAVCLAMNSNVPAVSAAEQENVAEDAAVVEFSYENVRYVISEENDGYVLTITPVNSEGIEASRQLELDDYKDKIVKVVVSEGITEINERCFEDFTGVQEVILPDSLHGLAIQSFYGCTSLKYIKIPDGVSSIPIYGFAGCTSLENVDLPDSIITIYHNAFSGCEALKSIRIPDACRTIESSAFAGCKNLWDVYLPDTPIRIHSYVFVGCEKLYDIRVKNNDADISERVFPDCTTIFCSKDSIVYSRYAAQCFTEDDLTGQAGDDVTYEYDVDTMTMYFHGSGSMYPDFYRRINTCVEHVVFDDDITQIIGCQFCYSLKSVKLPSSISLIPANCFYACWNLETVKIPASVDEIMGGAFQESGLRSVEFEDYDKSVWIGQDAFYKCKNLESIRIPKFSKSSGLYVLNDCSSLKTLYSSIDMDLKNYLINSEGNLSTRPECIYGYKFTSAEEFAKEYDIPFVSVSWTEDGGKWFWYEDGVKQGTEGRGKEIYDYATESWYWLDADNDGAKAVSKDVYMESEAGAWAENEDGTGKWVRYDADGHMLKGWATDENGTYYFDQIYGTMAKGTVTIDDREYTFDRITGVLCADGWVEIDGTLYWYENNHRQGYEPQDGTYRGKEIFDPSSDAWYWLDNVQCGARTVNKDVYQESEAGEWGENAGEDGKRYGKWVRYDENGHMIKGWSTTDDGTYYFDTIYGTMAHGRVTIDGAEYDFDETTGKLII